MAGCLLSGHGRDRVEVAAGPDDVDLPNCPTVSSDLGGHDLLNQVERDDSWASLVGSWSYPFGRRRVVGSPV